MQPQLTTYGLECLTPAASDPVSLEQARRNSAIDTDDHDERLLIHIKAATEWLQKQTDAVLITSEWRWTLDQFPRDRRWLLLPLWPVQSIEQIRYRDASGAWATVDLSSVVRRNSAGRSRIALTDWAAWPSPRRTPDAVQIDFTAGFGDSPVDVPGIWAQPILLLASHWFEMSEATAIGVNVNEIPFGVTALVEALRDGDDNEGFTLE